MSLSKKLLIAAVCCSVAGHCSVMYGMNNNADNYNTNNNADSMVERSIAAGSAYANVNAKNKDGMTALMWAAEKGVMPMVRGLLKKCADMNATDPHGMTALMYAAEKGFLDIVSELLAKGANVNARDRGEWTALDYAQQNNHPEIATMIKKYEELEPLNKALLHAVKDAGWDDAERAQKVSESIATGANVNATDTDGNTALIFAAKKGFLGIVNVLLKHHAYVNAPNRTGDTALMWAAVRRNLDVVNVLLAKGAYVNARNTYGFTALMVTICCGQDAAIGAAQLHGDTRSRRLLAETCYINIARKLIAATIAADEAANATITSSSSSPPKESSLNIKNTLDNNAALHGLIKWATALHDYPDLMTQINSFIRIMLDAGADPMIPNNAGETPVGLAQKFGVYDQLPALKNYVEKWNQMVKGDSLPGNDRYMISDLADIVSKY